MIALADLLALWLQRDRDAGPRQARDRETLEYFEGRVAVPLPELERNEQAAVANLMAQGITAQAQRIGSVSPRPFFATTASSKAAQQRARNKKHALEGMWAENQLGLQRRQRARWLVAYASAPVVVRPKWDAKRNHWSIKWEMRSPLSAYPAPTPAHVDMEPPDAIFASTSTVAKLAGIYPDRAPQLRAMRGKDLRDAAVTFIEYYAADEYVTAAVGTVSDWDQPSAYGIDYAHISGNRWCVELERAVNRVGRCCAIVPNAISLEQPMSRYESMKGIYQAQAKLNALQYRAIANDVDAATWFVESDTGGEIVTPADGPAGIVGHVRGGTLVNLHSPPGQLGFQMIDRYERAQRLEGGVSPDLGGESGTNIRTGRRGSDILSAVMDFPIQEAHELFAHSQWLEDRLAMDAARETFPGLNRSWGGFEFKPETTFSKDDWHTVDYAIAGTDADGQVIRVGQLNGTGLMSKFTSRRLIPDIKDPEFEDDMVTAEQIEQGILADFMQPSDPTVPGSLGLAGKARVRRLVMEDKYDLADAILKVQEETQVKQSTTVDPVEPGSPEAMPGIGGVAEQAGTAAPPESDLAGLSSLLTRLRGPQVFETPGERAAGVAASV